MYEKLVSFAAKQLGAFRFHVGDLALDFGKTGFGFLLAAGQIVHFLHDLFAAARKKRFELFARRVPDDADEDGGIHDAEQEVAPRQAVAVAGFRNLARNEDKSAGGDYSINFLQILIFIGVIQQKHLLV